LGPYVIDFGLELVCVMETRRECITVGTRSPGVGVWLDVYGHRNVLGLVEREHHAERSDVETPDAEPSRSLARISDSNTASRDASESKT
jgi:hypothetical protein